jgi:triphosphoribosyl-dephospho-CoA synthase
MNLDRRVRRLAVPMRSVPPATAPATLLPTFHGRRLGRLAARSLWHELVLYPKPGLVSLRDRGAHEDMDAVAFVRSLFALRPWFVELAEAGARRAPFAELRSLGIRAERAMLAATLGVNTHRGAIFTLGLLAAAAGSLAARSLLPTDEGLRSTLVAQWSAALATDWRAPNASSHGSMMAVRYGAAGARGQALCGFPAVFDIALPALRDAAARGAGARRARLAAFFALLERVEDTNVLYRGGPAGLAFVREAARDFARSGGAFGADAYGRAVALHRALIDRHLSPGGCADLLAAALFVDALQTGSAG